MVFASVQVVLAISSHASSLHERWGGRTGKRLSLFCEYSASISVDSSLRLRDRCDSGNRHYSKVRSSGIHLNDFLTTTLIHVVLVRLVHTYWLGFGGLQ